MSSSRQLFLKLYKKLHDDNNGYFSAEGIPYHSIENLIVEAPDIGHETTSEALSYYVWNEAMYGRITGDWSGLAKAWEAVEKLIPNQSEQPSNDGYNPNSPATYAPEKPRVEDYPVMLDTSVQVGSDPIYAELSQKHGTIVYGMHWMKDCDNFYGFGKNGEKSVFVNNFQRGENESCWKAITQPSIENFTSGGPNGFLDLFSKESGNGTPAKQYKYTIAPDADARIVQVIYWAKKWADARGGSPIVNDIVKKTAKMGDWLRYCFFDKYFKPIGCQDKRSRGGSGYESSHYLISWYYAFGGPTTPQGWAWKIGCSHNHFGYQNPFAAWVLANQQDFTKEMCVNAKRDWNTSFWRQIQFYQWLQSVEGAIAGGATNSFGGDYMKYPANTPTFFGMVYVTHPVFMEPPSNGWFGFQTWSMERIAQYYFETKDDRVLPMLQKWMKWAHDNIRWTPEVFIPVGLSWSGAPDASFSATNGLPPPNKNLRVTITSWNQDIGIMASLARCLLYVGHATDNKTFISSAKRLCDAILKFEDNLGFSTPEPRPDYINKTGNLYTTGFNTPVFIPTNFRGEMPNGDDIKPGATFVSLRSDLKKDPLYKKVEDGYKTGQPPIFHYHRFWAQSEILLLFGLMANFEDTQTPPQARPPTTVNVPARPMTPPPSRPPSIVPVPARPMTPPPSRPPTTVPISQNQLSITVKDANTWKNGQDTFWLQEVTLLNNSKNVVKNVNIIVNAQKIDSSWNSIRNGNTLSFPEWLINNGGLKPNESVTIGFIASGNNKPTVRLQ
jgi:hypothetical protein